MKKIFFSLLIVLLISTYNIVAEIPASNINNNTNHLLIINIIKKTDCEGYPPTETATYKINANQSDIIFLGTDDPQYASSCLSRVTSLKATLFNANVNPVTIETPQGAKGIPIKDYNVSIGRTDQGFPKLIVE